MRRFVGLLAVSAALSLHTELALGTSSRKAERPLDQLVELSAGATCLEKTRLDAHIAIWPRLFSLWTTNVDPADAVTVSGSFTGTFDPGDGPMTSAGKLDIFVAQFDPSGRLSWHARFGGAGSEVIAGTAVDPSGNVFVAGFESDDDTLFVAKIGR